MTAAAEDPETPGSAWRHLVRWLVLLLVLGVGIAAYYISENLRAEQAWEEYTREAGISDAPPDWQALLPKPVPAESNFYATPVLASAGIKGREDTLLVKQLQSVPAGLFVADVFNEKPARISAFVAELRKRGLADPKVTEIAAAHGGFEAIGRELDELRAASLRPYALFPSEARSPLVGPAPNFVTLRALSQSLSLRASLFLAEGRPDEAWRDLLVVWRITESLDSQLTLVATMIRVAITGLALGPVQEGLASGCWTEKELKAMQRQLEGINLVRSLELSLVSWNKVVVQELSPWVLRALNPPQVGTDAPMLLDLPRSALDLRPRGWVYRGLITYDRAMREQLGAFHSDQVRLDLPRLQLAAKEGEASMQGLKGRARVLQVSFVNEVKAADTAVRIQNQVNLGILACALTRYRLAHGAHPERLENLGPEFLTRLPQEVVTGKPYGYQRLPDGSFELRSAFPVGKGTAPSVGPTLRWFGKPL